MRRLLSSLFDGVLHYPIAVCAVWAFKDFGMALTIGLPIVAGGWLAVMAASRVWR
jgi:hypothetical protein